MGSVTLADVAEKAGVSTMTVSRVVRGLGGVSPETSAAVRVWIKKLGFQPDPLLGALAARRTGRRGRIQSASLAVVTPGNNAQVWNSVINFRENVAGAEAAALQLGYGFEKLCAGTTPASWRTALKVLEARGVRGLCLPPVHILVPEEVDFSAFSAVNMGFGHRRTGFHIIRHDLYEMATLALRELIDRGFCRLGVVSTRDEERSDYRVSGAALALGQTAFGRKKICAPLILPEPPFQFSEVSRSLFRAWMERERPDGIIGLQGQVYASWLEGFRRRIPPTSARKVAVVILNLCETASGSRPKFAGVGVCNRQIGAMAVEKLHAMIQRGETGRPAARQIITLAARWIDGRSVTKKGGGRD